MIYHDQTKDIEHFMSLQQSITHKVLLTFSTRPSRAQITSSTREDVHSIYRPVEFSVN
jgi:hypothetical protein